jgi:hypothetical protein
MVDVPAGEFTTTTTVGLDVTQVGLYALAAQDGTVLRGAFDSFTVEHQEGALVLGDTEDEPRPLRSTACAPPGSPTCWCPHWTRSP